MQSRTVYNPAAINNHRKPAVANLPKAAPDYGKPKNQKRRGRRPFGSPK